MATKKYHPIVAQIFWNGKIKSVLDKEYQDMQLPVKKYFDNFEQQMNKYGNFDKIEAIINKRDIGGTAYKTFLVNGTVDVALHQVKNSGVEKNDNKRIKTVSKEFHNRETYLIGGLWVGDRIVYFLTKDMYLDLKNLTTSVSKNPRSFWISFENIKMFLQNKDEDFWYIDDAGTSYFYSLQNLFKRLNFQMEKELNTSEEDLDIPDLFDGNETFDFAEFEEPEIFNFETIDDKTKSIDKLIRNYLIVEKYRENHDVCENCGRSQTFLMHGTNKNYFEIHHFLPYNKIVQKDFSRTLDSYTNLVNLCVDCHKAIHLGTEDVQKEIIGKLLIIKSTSFFEKWYGILNVNQIYNYYLMTFNLKEENE